MQCPGSTCIFWETVSRKTVLSPLLPRLPALIKTLAQGAGGRVWNVEPRMPTFPFLPVWFFSLFSPFQLLPHQSRATFTSRFPHLLVLLSHLRSLLSSRCREPGTSASDPAPARKKLHCTLPLPVRALGAPCPVGC
jgi:hypothetical protein